MDPKDKQQIVIAAAAIALHGLLASGRKGPGTAPPIAESFDIGELFVAEAIRRGLDLSR